MSKLELEKFGLNELREKFLSFYESKDHYRRQSFSLIPESDKSLLIINSGMAPLKPYFAGVETPPSKRMTTCQKCIRTGDIDNVGLTSRHGTFFEMLGSFSFGDYFKDESLHWGWEFITEVLHLPVDRIWATIYQDDDQAYEIWREIGLPDERIVRLGKDDNFWEIGLGPCGPDSEIFFDRGEEYGCGKPDCKPGCECDRYIEFWNHVFTQFNREEDGTYTDLVHKNIDTGMGLERLACIMQDVDSIFDIDTIRYILDGVIEKSGVKYEGDSKGNEVKPTDVSIRIITDHIRSITFMIADGIQPSNEGRGYVLRRLLRRAARHGRLLGISGPFLTDLAERVVKVSGDAYPELKQREDYIKKIISIEEEKFVSTIDQGSNILDGYMEELKASGATVLDGAKAFKLYDTYGFPLELTKEILAEQGITVDEDAFAVCMEEQKTRARAGQKDTSDEAWDENFIDEDCPKTVFTGYSTLNDTARVLGIYKDKESVDSAAAGEEVLLIFDKTPFYTESGGQVSDAGCITAAGASSETSAGASADACAAGEGFAASVTNLQKINDIVLHTVEIKSGSIKTGDEVALAVDAPKRNNTARNHTATHMLQAALRQVLGDHVNQAGSKVTEDTLRFDFNHYEAMTAEQIKEVEKIVNEKICLFMPVNTTEKSIEDALADGVTALFGEKYGDVVRVVDIPGYSKELCGGTHVSNTGQVGAFKIVSEGGVAAGIRRIEAVTGHGVYKQFKDAEDELAETARSLKASPKDVASKVASLCDEVKALRKEIEELKKESMGDQAGQLVENAEVFGDVRLVTARLENMDTNELRNLSDDLKAYAADNGKGGIVVVLANEAKGKVTFLVSVSDDITDKYHAGKMIKQIAAAAGGGGGGKANMAQAGAKDPSKIGDAFDVARSLLG